MAVVAAATAATAATTAAAVAAGAAAAAAVDIDGAATAAVADPTLPWAAARRTVAGLPLIGCAVQVGGRKALPD